MQPAIINNRRRDILLLIFSTVSMLGLAGLGCYLVISRFTSSTLTSTTDLVSGLLNSIGMFICAALLVPLLVYCIRKLKGHEPPLAKLLPVKLWQLIGLFVAWAFLITLGSILSKISSYGEMLATPFYVLGIALPIAGLVWVAIGGLPAGSWRRLWAAFSIGLAGSTSVCMLLEYSLVGIAALVVGIVAVFNPEWLSVLLQVKNQLANSNDIQAILITLAPYLVNPLVLLLALFFMAGVAPVIEEAIKPAAVWLLGKRLQSPAEGFALGALCGAGFAMLEGTLAASGMAQMLGFGAAARLASSMMHITASGIMGWGIASARLEKRIGRLAGTYLLSVGLHGLWNGSVVLAVFGGLRITTQSTSPDLLGGLLVVAGIGILGSLLVTIMILLPTINRRLRPAHPVMDAPAQSDIIAPLQP
jgi:RsiW-degrading membrane proteinase PrsW (M82 family)